MKRATAQWLESADNGRGSQYQDCSTRLTLIGDCPEYPYPFPVSLSRSVIRVCARLRDER